MRFTWNFATVIMDTDQSHTILSSHEEPDILMDSGSFCIQTGGNLRETKANKLLPPACYRVGC
ncbi:hypothetical protein Q0L85_14295, partial [Staphylococcus aureus]|nr:hypothetical protein [Staphylococcus aureus]